MKNLDDLTVVILTFQTPDEIILNCLRSIDKNVIIVCLTLKLIYIYYICTYIYMLYM